MIANSSIFPWKMEFTRVMNVIETLHISMEHHHELVRTILGPHCYFFYVLIHDVDLIVP